MSARDANPYEISRLLYSLRDPASREAVRADAEAYYQRFAIGAGGMRLLLDGDWQGLVDAGVTVYLLTKLGAVLGVSLLEMGAAMRGMSDEQFRRFIEEQNQRNRPLALLPSGTVPEKAKERGGKTTIVAGLGCSHAPSIARAYDIGASGEAEWKPLFDAFARAGRWLAEQRPDALIVIYNDHVDNYFVDAWPTFAIGVADRYQIADEGWGPRRFAPVPGHRALASHLAAQLIGRGFDLTASHRMELDHGFLSPMPLIDEDWRIPVVPMTINVVFDPLPSPARCWALGEALGAAIESFPQDLRVAVIGTGGLSHQLTGPNFGKVFAQWDREFLTLLDQAPQSLNRFTMEDFARSGGEHSIEVVQWMTMRAALPEPTRTEFTYYYPFGLMGYSIAAFRPA